MSIESKKRKKRKIQDNIGSRKKTEDLLVVYPIAVGQVSHLSNLFNVITSSDFSECGNLNYQIPSPLEGEGWGEGDRS